MENRIEFKPAPIAGNIRIFLKGEPIGSLLRNIKGFFAFYPMYEIRNQIILLSDWEEIGRKWKELEEEINRDGKKDNR